MRSSSKSRSRNKNNRGRSNPGNVVNRVFDSSGPEGKVRGTPQQIIDKYQALARDAQLSGDRVAAENFLQHAEHYLRLLSEAQKEIDAKREQQEQQRQQHQQKQQQNAAQQQGEEDNAKPAEGGQDQQPRKRAKRSDNRADGSGDQPSLPDTADLFPAGDEDIESNLVDTPENSGGDKPPKPRRSRSPKKDADPAPSTPVE